MHTSHFFPEHQQHSRGNTPTKALKRQHSHTHTQNAGNHQNVQQYPVCGWISTYLGKDHSLRFHPEQVLEGHNERSCPSFPNKRQTSTILYSCSLGHCKRKKSQVSKTERFRRCCKVGLFSVSYPDLPVSPPAVHRLCRLQQMQTFPTTPSMRFDRFSNFNPPPSSGNRLLSSLLDYCTRRRGVAPHIRKSSAYQSCAFCGIRSKRVTKANADLVSLSFLLCQHQRTMDPAQML